MSSAELLRRRTAAVELRAQGLEYDQIAAALGYANRSGAWKAVQVALRQHESAAVDHYRRLTAARQEELLAAVWTAATAGDLDAVESALRIIDSQMRLYSLGKE